MFSYNGTTAPSSRELSRIYQAAFSTRLATGEIQPLVIPYDGYGLFALLIYLCIPHVNRPWLYAARWPVLAFIVVFDVNLILQTRTMYGGTGFGVGLVAAWAIVWSFTWLVWNRPQWEARRVQRREGKSMSKKVVGEQITIVKPEVNGDVTSVANGKPTRKDEKIRRRKQQNGHSKAAEQKGAEEEEDAKETGPSEYYWQSYPTDSFRERIDWVFDLIFNFRGPGWNWEVPTNPSLPAHVKVGLGEPIDLKSMQMQSSVGIKRFSSRADLIRSQTPRFIFGYLLLDGLKTLLMKDPYFLLGPNPFPPPPYLSSLSPDLIQIARRLLSLIAIITALELIFLLAPLFFCLILGPSILNARGEYWQYPTTWGTFTPIFKTGLQGLWGGWWHQTFRYAFAAPTNFLIRHEVIKPKSYAAKLVGLVCAFGLSGFLHGSGSYTQLPHTLPLNPMLFFMLQAVGIFLQSSFCEFCKPWITKYVPYNMRTAGNFAFTFTWLYCTAPLLIDDFARGGVWLFQPVPVSLFRGLGYGETGDGWWCWGDVRLYWYTGRHWWETGLAL